MAQRSAIETEKMPAGETAGAGELDAAGVQSHSDFITGESASQASENCNFLDAALAYARKGWPVFPLAPRSKAPLISKEEGGNGCSDATTDEGQIRAWWDRCPTANIGVNVGMAGLLVVDVDPRHGGDETWHGLKQRHGLGDDTLTSLTGGGGRHLLFKLDGRDPSTLDGKLGDGVDVKRGNSYIVVSPSVHPDGPTYEWELSGHPDDREPADLSPSLAYLLTKGNGSKPEPSRNDGGKIPEGKRDNTLTSLAGTMRRRGMTEAEILAALLAANANRCDPPLDQKEVERIAKSIARYAPDDPILRDPPADAGEDRPEIAIFSLADILADDTPLPPDVVEGFLPGEAAVLISGPGGDGKSYAMLDLAVCVARGTPWLGLGVTKAPVLILDLENKKTLMRQRVGRVLQGHALLDDPPAVNIAFDIGAKLDADDGAFEMMRQVERVGAGLVILDSLVDFLGDVEENSNPEMARVAERLRLVAERAGVTILAIHHTPKAGSTPRGATALRNGVDVSIMVARDGNVFRMKQDKNRMGSEQTVTARLNWGDGLFNLSPIGVSVGREKPPPDVDEAAILDTLDGGGWMASNDIVAEAMERTGHTRRTLQRKLKAMIDDLVLDQKEQGRGFPYLARLVKDDTSISLK